MTPDGRPPAADGAVDDRFESAYRLFHDLPFIGMAITSRSTKRWLKVNERLCDMLGYARNELLEKSWDELTHADDLQRDVAEFQRVLRGDANGYALDKRFIRANGDVMQASMNVKAVRDEFGAVDYFVVMISDITARVDAEAAAHRSAALLQKLSQQVPGVIYQFQLRPDGTSFFPFVSENMAALSGVQPGDLRESAQPLFDHIHPDDSARVTASVRESAQLLSVWQCEYRVVLPNRDVRWRYGNAKPERLADGSTLWHGFITDSTETKKLQAQFLHAQKMESVGRLAGGIAHDFNNLLTVLKGCLELVLERVEDDSALRDDLLEMNRATDSASALTQQLLAFSRKQIIAPQVLDLGEVVQSLRGMLQRLLGEDIVLKVVTVSDMRVCFDPGQAEQILVNLAVNARDAMPSGGALTIETSPVVLDDGYIRTHPGAETGEFVLLAVSDSGVGMTEEVLAHAFEPFFTTKEVGQGTGLGLAMIHGAVQQNGGRVEVYSEPGFGTSFKIFLPRVSESVTTPTPTPRPAVPRGDETVLLVEDDTSVRELVTRVLTRQGYTVRAFENGQAALAWVRENDETLHLLLTDVIMPGMNGKVLAETITALRPGIRVLYASGYTANVIVHHGVLKPGVEFLAKPFAASDLALRVRQLLDAPVL